MEYAKYINENTIEVATNVIFDNDIYIANPTESILIEHGYKPVIEGEKPSFDVDSEYLVPLYQEEDDKILKTWVIERFETEEYNEEE
jgi:hypothetical protein